MTYNFDTNVAEEYGVNEAIMIANLQFWINKNKANNKNYYDGHFWTYNSCVAFTKLFPFWTAKQIEYILEKLVKKGVVITGNYHLNKSDRSKWYAFVDEAKWLMRNKEESLKTPENCISENCQIISENCRIISENSEMYIYDTDNKPDNKPDDGNNACAYEQHQQVLEKAQPYKEMFLTDLWITEFVALWNMAAEGRENWQKADIRYIKSFMRQKIKQRANEFYNKYKPTHPEMSEKTLAEDLIKATIYRYDNSDAYQGLTKGQVAFTIQKIFTNDKDWYKFLNCEWVQR